MYWAFLYPFVCLRVYAMRRGNISTASPRMLYVYCYISNSPSGKSIWMMRSSSSMARTNAS